MGSRAVVAFFVALALGICPSALTAPDRTTLRVDRHDARCSNAKQRDGNRPYCSIGAAALRVSPGQTVLVAAGNYRERVAVHRSGTRRAPVVFAAAPGANVTLSGRGNGFYLSDVSWVTVTGFNVSTTRSYGIAVLDASHITLSRNRVSRAGIRAPAMTAYGIYLSDVSDSLVLGNITYANSDAGIALTNGATRNVVESNRAYDNARGYVRAAAGIHLYSAPANTVAGNVSYDNEDAGIEFQVGSSNALVSNNITYDNGDHGIDVSKSPMPRILSNTVRGNATAGINVEGGSSHALIENNIAVDNAVDSHRTKGNISVDVTSADGTRMNFDQLYLTNSRTLAGSPYLAVWGTSKFRSLLDLQTATGQEANGIAADPAWEDVQSGDFHLTAVSPGIDSADCTAPGQPARDSEGRPRRDDPGIPNTGAGSPPYSDRGALEFYPR
jgi:parallel beta-helix repeat protein